MEKFYEIMKKSPKVVQVLLVALGSIGLYVVYRFRYLVLIIAIAAIVIYMSMQGGM